MQTRQQHLAARWQRTDADEDLLALARAEYHLAELAYRDGRPGDARVLLETGLRQSSRYNERTGSKVNPVGLQLLRGYAEVHLYGNEPLARFRRDLEGELTHAYDWICRHPSPRWAPLPVTTC